MKETPGERAKRLCLCKPHIYRGRKTHIWLISLEGIIEENIIDRDLHRYDLAVQVVRRWNDNSILRR